MNRVKWFHDKSNWSNISVYHLWMACFASKCSPSFPADRTAVNLLSALHSHYSCDRVPSAPLEEDVDGCQATAYPCHPLHLHVNDSVRWGYACAWSQSLTMSVRCSSQALSHRESFLLVSAVTDFRRKHASKSNTDLFIKLIDDAFRPLQMKLLAFQRTIYIR